MKRIMVFFILLTVAVTVVSEEVVSGKHDTMEDVEILEGYTTNSNATNKQEQSIDEKLPISYEDYELNHGGAEMKIFLPIGSVVLLKESTKKIMIVGVKQKQVGTEKIWDYSACLYPEGVINPQNLYLFDAKQIDIIFSLGFQDAEGIKFNEFLGQLEN